MHTNLDLHGAIHGHIERHVGPVSGVFQRVAPENPEIRIFHVSASKRRRFDLLVTSGMSERPMATPPCCGWWRFAELVMLLPAGWPLDEVALLDDRTHWPVRLIHDLALCPHENETWFGFGHTVTAPGHRPPPYAPDTWLNGVILLPPRSLPAGFCLFSGPGGRQIHFWAVVPLYWEEMEFKLEEGAHALFRLLVRQGIGDILDPWRPNAVVASRPRPTLPAIQVRRKTAARARPRRRAVRRRGA